MVITRVSPHTGKTNHMDLLIHPKQIEAYKKGVSVQNAFPNLSPDEREFIKTGLTPEDWADIFADSEE